jgi:hypothetical protein
MAKTTVTLTNEQIIDYISYSNSDKFWQANNKNVPGKLSWITRMNKKAIQRAFELVQEAEQDINDNYKDKIVTRKDENGNDIEYIKDEFKDQFINEKLELFAQTQDVDLELIDPSMLFDFNMTDNDWDNIAFMLKDDPTLEAEYNEQEVPRKAPEPVTVPNEE